MSFCLKNYICLHLSLCHYVLKRISVSHRHYVILSKKKHLSPSVTMLFCLQNKSHLLNMSYSVTLSSIPCLPPSLCYSVLKTTPSVTSVLLLLCLKKLPCPSVPRFSCLKMYMFVFFINYLLFRCILSFFY